MKEKQSPAGEEQYENSSDREKKVRETESSEEQ